MPHNEAQTMARQMMAHHRNHGISDATVFRIEPHSWSVVGPTEWYSHLLGQHGYLVVYSRGQSVADLAAWVIKQAAAQASAR